MSSITSRKKKNKFGLGNEFQIKEIQPLTDGQKDTFEAYKEDFNLVLTGCAGTGKTYISMALALKDVLAGLYTKLLIIRSTVPTRELGFLPGTPEEKVKVYETPYSEICSDLFGNSASYNMLKDKGAIDFCSTSFLRGNNLRNCIILVDEIQNMNFQELDTVITRVCNDSKIIFCGDIAQTDLNSKNDKSGIKSFVSILESMDEFDFVEFGVEDIVRSGLVKNYLIKKYNLGI